jgi:HK97 family phage prohead protease
METKFLALEVKADDEGVIEGYGAVFGNKDSYNDILVKGAFAEGMGRKVKMLWQHDPAQPIGVWDEMSEDDNGLRMKGRFAMNTAKGREAYELVKMGAIDGLSIGYRTKDADDKDGARYLKSVDLFEVSLVTMPANDKATVTSIKNITTRDVERDLREAGYSRSQAKAIALKGVSGLREADEEAQFDALKAAMAAFSETARKG